eukprot:jgi/Ulvmu1/7134/UM034_0040.1
MAEEKSRSSGAAPASDAAPLDQGILIEMNDNNDICINATHLTVKCDNSFLVQGNSTGKVSAQGKGSTVAGKSSVVVVQQDKAPVPRVRLLLPKKYAKSATVAGAILMTCRVAGRVASWQWVRNRAERALAGRSASQLSHLLSHSNPRTQRAVVTHIALDIQHASNIRLTTPDLVTFPSISDAELSRMSAASARERAGAEQAALRDTAAAPSPLSHEHVRPASALSVVSAETTNSSSDGGDSSTACTPQRPQSPVDGIVTHPAPPPTKPILEGPDAVSSKVDSAEPCTSAAAQAEHSIPGEVAACPQPAVDGSVAPADAAPPRRAHPSGPWPGGAPAEGRAACMLAQDTALWDAFAVALCNMLRSSDLGLQHDAAFAVQVVAFASERLAQQLIDAGIVKQLLACVPDVFGSRVRVGGARLRQPGTRMTRTLPDPNSLLAISPIHMPSVHMDIKHRSVTLTPRGINYAFLSMVPSLGRRLQRQLLPRCRATAAKRAVALEALQNVTALRTGAKALLAVDGSLDVICSASYTASAVGRLAAIEVAHSCMLAFPRCRTQLYHVGFDQALANTIDRTSSSVVREACMRTWMRLQPDRELLSSDTGRGSMYS